MKIVFLDIDGVLLPFEQTHNERVCCELLPDTNGCPGFDLNCVAELNRICSQSRACVVVSSSWRQHIPCLETMRLVLRHQGILAHVAGLTPIAEGEWDRHDRGDEISHFLNDFSADSIVIIDDLDMGFEGFEDVWVRPRSQIGLQHCDAEKAISILEI